MKNNFQKSHLQRLLEDVIIPFEKFILENETLSQIIADSIQKHNAGVAKTAVKILLDYKKAQKQFIELANMHAELNIDKETFLEYTNTFFELHQKWYQNCFGEIDDEYKDKIQKLKNLFIESFNDSCNIEDEFFMFDEDSDFEETNHISAEEFFTNNPLSAEDIEDITIIRDMLLDILDEYQEINSNFIEDLEEALRKFNTKLSFIFSTNEFDSIQEALLILDELLKTEEETILQTELSFPLLVAFIEDFIKWIDNIFIYQNTKDIHYLDASLLANITQFKIVIKNNG